LKGRADFSQVRRNETMEVHQGRFVEFAQIESPLIVLKRKGRG
jgi:hypothetical protein